jgi:maltokinase
MRIEQAWLQLLPTQRWFAGKGRQLDGVDVRPGSWFPASDARLAVRPETVVARYGDGSQESYQAVSAYRPQAADVAAPGPVVEFEDRPPALLIDATLDPEAFSLVLDALDLGPAVPRGEIVPFPAEQSNSSVRIGDRALFKLFRRPDGPNREAELLAALSDSGVTPKLHATATEPDGTTWAIVMELVHTTGDGWKLATRACAEGKDFTQPAAGLGRALRNVHTLLEQAFGASTRSGDDIAKGMLTRLTDVAGEAPEVAALADRIRPLYEALEGTTVACQQLHGDFHLGQVLHRDEPSGWVLIDFEGEPLKTPQERREPDSVWRDVAGALRSFDYARSAHADPSGAAARAWSAAARSAFLEGYLAGGEAPRAILAAYLIDKAVYEVRYELRNRPDWVGIPLGAIEDELDGVLDAPEPKEQ